MSDAGHGGKDSGVVNALKEPAIFISIHFNSGGRSARGIETFTLSLQGVPLWLGGEIQRLPSTQWKHQ